jgi:Flp pilus assembly protein TadD
VLNIFFRGVTNRLPLAVAALILCVPAVLTAQPQALIEKSQRGMELMAAGKFEDAIPVYRELSRAVPDNPGLLLNLGMALQLAGHSRQAIAPLERALKLAPSTLPAWLFLGAAYLGVAEPAKAVPPLRQYVALQPADPSGHRDLGDAPSPPAPSRCAPEFLKATDGSGESARLVRLNRCYTALAQEAFQSVEKAAPESAYWLALVADERVIRPVPKCILLYRKRSRCSPTCAACMLR